MINRTVKPDTKQMAREYLMKELNLQDSQDVMFAMLQGKLSHEQIANESEMMNSRMLNSPNGISF